ncbi:MAG TPA: DMT family transporter [Methylomirabilota bacterium]|nr:DMT family transporter [Methylomirabilota bacterium]
MSQKGFSLTMQIVDDAISLPLDRSQTGLALLALFGGAFGIAFAPIFVRLSLVGPVATAFWRLALALPALWLWVFLEKQQEGALWRFPQRAAVFQLALAGLFFSGDLAVWHWSIRLTSVANATLLANFAPIFVAFAGWLFFGYRVGVTLLFGMGAALVGTTLMVGASFSVSLQHLLGDALGLITAMFYAGYILTVKRLRDDLSTGTIMAWSGTIMAGMLFAVAFLSEEQIMPLSWQGWRPLIGLALMSQVVGQSLITYALAHLPAAFSSVGLLLQPVMATVFAWLILSETVNGFQVIGGGCVFIGIVIARRVS